MKILKKLMAVLVLAPGLAMASGGGFALDRAPERNSVDALQNGAKLFVNYCLNCHAASAMRYNRMKEIGLSEEQIRKNLILTDSKVGDLMTIAMNPKDAKNWFGATPPDLSVIARAKSSAEGSGADYLYTYLRTYYKNDSRPTGWDNLVFPGVGMPHVLWELQGVRNVKYIEAKDPHDSGKTVHKFAGFEQVKPGKMTPLEFDVAVADLVAYIDWMGEPIREKRTTLGIIVLMFLGLFCFLAWRLSASYWKEVK